MPLDPVRVEEVRGWLTKAATDLRAADHDRTASPPLLEDVVFHAQRLPRARSRGAPLPLGARGCVSLPLDSIRGSGEVPRTRVA
jgi:hypothetical protein